MDPGVPRPTFFIGWDVGGWNCDRNRKSRDAIVILDDTMDIVGKPWRGNLSNSISNSCRTYDWLQILFEKCEEEFPKTPANITMAIDTPLGFPDAFVSLITGKGFVEADRKSGRNRYLFRHTERLLFERNLPPLSSIKDMIGSQATKGMHVVAKFAPKAECCGVWTDGASSSVIETYPTACRNTKPVKEFLHCRPTLEDNDREDARICALIAYYFAKKRDLLQAPNPNDIRNGEGWIWIPTEA